MATERKRTSGKRSIATKRKRATGKREVLKSRNATFFARRNAKGRFKEMDEQGRSLTTDRRRTATTKAKRGYGDRGDRAA